MEEFRRRIVQMQRKRRGGLRGFFSFRRAATRERVGLSIPWSALTTALALGFALKAAIILEYGENRYRAQLAKYDGQQISERIGAFIMQPDPITLGIRDFADQVTRR